MQAINWLTDRNQRYDIIVLLEPTSPLRQKDDIDSALNPFIRNMDAADSLVSLGEVQLENLYIMKTIENGLVMPLMEL